MQLPGTMVRKAIKAGREDDWSPLMNIDEVNPWMMEKMKKSDYQARQEDDQGNSLVQHVQRTVPVKADDHGGGGTSDYWTTCLKIENGHTILILSRQKPSKSSTWDQFKVIQEGTKSVQDCKTMCLSLADGPMTFNTWDHRLSTGPCVKEISLQEGSDFKKDNRHASLQQSIQWQHRWSLLATNRSNRERFHKNWNEDGRTMLYIGLICDSRKTKDWNFDRPSILPSYHCVVRFWQFVW